MDTRSRLQIAPNDTAAGAVPDVRVSGPMVLFIAVVLAVCLVVPLLMTLPQTLDATASPAPLIRETMGQPALQAATAEASEPTFHERHPVQGTAAWIDTLEDSELANWRLRSGD